MLTKFQDDTTLYYSFIHSLSEGACPLTPPSHHMAPPRWGAVPPGLVTREGNSSHAGGGGAGQVGLPGSPTAPCEDASMVSAGGFSLLGPEGLLLLGHPPQPPLLAARTPPKLNPYLFGAPTLGPRSSARWRSGGAGHPWQSGRCGAGAWWPGACSGRGGRGPAQCPAPLGASSQSPPPGQLPETCRG